MHPDTLNFIGTKLAGIELPEFLAYGVYVGEVLAPLMIIVGYSSRLGGVLVVINMLFAIVLMHGGDVFSLSPHGGWALELQGFYLFGGLAVALLGSGSYAFRPD
jgi:putative oxidoreductase